MSLVRIKVINFLTLKQIAMLLEIHTRERNVHQYNAICKHLGNSPLKIHLIYKILFSKEQMTSNISVLKYNRVYDANISVKVLLFSTLATMIKCIEHITSLRQRNSQYKWNHQMRVMWIFGHLTYRPSITYV